MIVLTSVRTGIINIVFCFQEMTFFSFSFHMMFCFSNASKLWVQLISIVVFGAQGKRELMISVCCGVLL